MYNVGQLLVRHDGLKANYVRDGRGLRGLHFSSQTLLPNIDSMNGFCVGGAVALLTGEGRLRGGNGT